MASSEQPLCSQNDVDVESSSEVRQEIVEAPSAATSRKSMYFASAIVMLGIVAFAAVSTPRNARPTPSAKSLLKEAQRTIISMAATADDAAADRKKHQRITYGLHKATCPDKVTGKSEGAKVTLDAIKEFVGAKKSDKVEFWWVYPEPKAKKDDDEHKDWSAETQFSVFGGYVYHWGDNDVCLALTPQGTDLTLAPSSAFPKVDIDWHKPAGDSVYAEYAWIPPAADKECEHGCFVYKSKDGEKTSFSVV